MSGPGINWRDRCEMFFSSMDNYAEREDKKLEKRKSKKKMKVKTVDEKNATHPPGWQPGFFGDNVTTFSKQTQPFEGLIRWLSCVDLHGTKMILRSRSHVFCLLWIFITIVGCGVCGFGFYKEISDYMDEDLEIHSKVVSDGNNASPLSLMVCNANMIRKSRINQSRFNGFDDLNVSYIIQDLGAFGRSSIPAVDTVLAGTEMRRFLEEENLLDKSSILLGDLNEEYRLYSEMVNESDWVNAGRLLLLMGDEDPFRRVFRLTSTELDDLGYAMDSSILGCTKNGRQCDSSEISYVKNAEYGQCAVIHLSLEDSWFDDLTLTMDVQPEEYINLVSPNPGIRAIVQSELSLSTSWLPIQSHDFIVARPGEGVHLNVAKTHEMRRKPKNCNNDPNYNRMDCLSRCLILHTADVCGCSISLPSPLSLRCRVDVQYEFLCHRLLRELYQRNQLPCACPHPCKEEYLDVTASTFSWIKNDSEVLLSASLDVQGKTYNFSDIRDSVTKVRVSWRQSSYVRLEEEEQLSLLGLFLRLGSISAITVGISVITVIELLWLLGKTIVHVCCAVKKQDSHSDAVHQIYPVQHMYPEFNTIQDNRHSWFANSGRGQGEGRHAQIQSYAHPPGLSDSPLNRRRVNNYSNGPTPGPYQHDYKAINSNRSGVRTQWELIYRGRPNNRGETSTGRDVSSPIQDGRVDSANHQKNVDHDPRAQPWKGLGQNGVYTKVFVPNRNSSHQNKEVPLFNSPYMTVGDDRNDDDPANVDKSQYIGHEGNSLNGIIKSINQSDNSKTMGSGEHSNTESREGVKTDVAHQNKEGEGHGDDDNGNNDIFKISQADSNDISWIPEDVANMQGPDLSNLNSFLLASTNKLPGIYTASQDGRRQQKHQQQHRSIRSQRAHQTGFGRTTKANGGVGATSNGATPPRSNGAGVQQNKHNISPNTWYNYTVSSDNLPPPPPPPPPPIQQLTGQPMSYVIHDYNDRDAIFTQH